jgi:teichuronic acid biosynthesis glycosyltransferase TuaH
MSMQTTLAQGPPWDILFVGYGDWILWRWDGFRTRSAQLCRFLARSDRFTNMYVLNESIYLHHLQRGFAVPRRERFRALPVRGGLRKEEEKIHLLEPSRFLVGPDRLKRPYTTRLILKSIRKLARPPILWIANVHKAHLMEQIPASLKIFDAIDDWESISVYQQLGQRIRSGYETVMEHADIIYTVSRQLEKKFLERAKTPHVRHLPNGVDPQLFRLTADPPSVRQGTRKNRRPVLTYVGVLSERVDLNLIEKISQDWPQCSFQLIGPMSRAVEQRWTELQRIPNLEWKGLVHHSKIPDILRSSDVLLIPHMESPLSLSMDPLKLYEYLTTGLPIVSTPVPPTGEYDSLVHIGTGQRFSEQIGAALDELLQPDAEDRWLARIEESRKHHWDLRIARIESDIGELLKNSS